MLVQIDSSAHTFPTHALPGILKKEFPYRWNFSSGIYTRNSIKGDFLIFDLTSRIWYMRNAKMEMLFSNC